MRQRRAAHLAVLHVRQQKVFGLLLWTLAHPGLVVERSGKVEWAVLLLLALASELLVAQELCDLGSKRVSKGGGT
jgi:hypothetical protein